MRPNEGGADAVELVRSAGKELAELVRSELALAREQIGADVQDVKRNAVGFGTAAFLTVVGIELLLGSLAVAKRRSPSLLVALGLAAIGTGIAFGRQALAQAPRPLRTRERTDFDEEAIQEVLG